MKASFFSSVFYLAPAPKGWPTAATGYEAAAAKRSMAAALEQFRLADEVGFDWVTVAEHHFGPFGLTPNPMVFAGAMTQVVRRAKIALLGPTIPILNPVRVADGRVIAGMMRGTPNEYVTYNINPLESRSRFEEGLELIRLAWTEKQPFGWEGRHFKYRSVSIWPRPVQDPHPPIYMSGSSRESAEFAARSRVSLGLAVTTVPLAALAAQRYREAAHATGWDPGKDDLLFRLSFHVADTDEQALADYEESQRRPQRGSPVSANPALEAAIAGLGYYGADVRQRERVLEEHGLKDRIALGRIIIGSPETVVSQIAAIARALGPGVLDAVSAFQLGERTNHSIALFGEKVLPRIREM